MSSFNAEVVSGNLPKKNVRLYIARPALIFAAAKLRVFSIGERTFIENEDFAEIIDLIQRGQRSDYYNDFYQGATIVPRQFWLVDVGVPKFGIDTRTPTLATSQRAKDRAKQRYEDVSLKGRVESDFLYQVATGSELVPFGHLEFPLGMLPIQPSSGRYRIVTSEEAKIKGCLGLSHWLVKAESIWKEKRGEKSEISVYGWLNYQNKLTNQSSRSGVKILYNTSGTYLVGCVVENKPSTVKLNGATITSKGVLADMTTCYCDTSKQDEAWYMVAFLNAPVIDRLIKPMQPKGDFGERHIAKKVLELPIPTYKPNDNAHKDLADLGKECSLKVRKILPSLAEKYASIGKIRQEVKEVIQVELSEIDRIVREILLQRGNVNQNNLENFLG